MSTQISRGQVKWSLIYTREFNLEPRLACFNDQRCKRVSQCGRGNRHHSHRNDKIQHMAAADIIRQLDRMQQQMTRMEQNLLRQLSRSYVFIIFFKKESSTDIRVVRTAISRESSTHGLPTIYIDWNHCTIQTTKLSRISPETSADVKELNG